MHINLTIDVETTESHGLNNSHWTFSFQQQTGVDSAEVEVEVEDEVCNQCSFIDLKRCSGFTVS